MLQRQREYDDKRRLARREAEREVERVKEAARIHVGLGFFPFTWPESTLAVAVSTRATNFRSCFILVPIFFNLTFLYYLVNDS